MQKSVGEQEGTAFHWWRCSGKNKYVSERESGLSQKRNQNQGKRDRWTDQLDQPHSVLIVFVFVTSQSRWGHTFLHICPFSLTYSNSKNYSSTKNNPFTASSTFSSRFPLLAPPLPPTSSSLLSLSPIVTWSACPLFAPAPEMPPASALSPSPPSLSRSFSSCCPSSRLCSSSPTSWSRLRLSRVPHPTIATVFRWYAQFTLTKTMITNASVDCLLIRTLCSVSQFLSPAAWKSPMFRPCLLFWSVLQALRPSVESVSVFTFCCWEVNFFSHSNVPLFA